MIVRTAFVLGAGLGTRLKALTSHRPKPLIPVVNKPLISYAFDHLLAHGIQRFVVNTHWRAEVYDREFPEASYAGAPISFRDEQPEVLETAGGIKNVEDLLEDEPFIVYNGDILATLPLDAAFREHAQRQNEVTMVLRSQDGPLQVDFDESTGLIRDISRRIHADGNPGFLFTGIYLVSPSFLRRIPAATKISVIPIFIEMIRQGAKLGGVVIDDGHWWDLGSRDQYLAVHKEIAAGTPLLASGVSPLTHPAPWVAPGASVAAGATLLGATAVGAQAVIGSGAILEDTIVWPGAVVSPNTRLTRCVVVPGIEAAGTHLNEDLA